MTSERSFGELDAASNPGVGIGSHGGYPTTPHRFLFNGLIDELKLYDEPLSADQVLADFNAGKGSLQPAVSINNTVVTEGDLSFKYLNDYANPSKPYHIIYGPDGHLYVTTLGGSSVLRYNGMSGAPLPAR